MPKREGRKERIGLVTAVHLFLLEDKRILLLRRYNTGYRDGEYSVPAGHLDGGEKTTEAMIREAKEEVGVKITQDNLTMVHLTHRNSEEERLDLFFTADNWEGTPEIMEHDKCDELKWFPLDELPGNMVPYVKEAVNKYRNSIMYSEFGWIVPDEK